MIPSFLPTPENIARAAAALRRGELVGMPTETVYGLAGDAMNPQALARIFEIKRRPFFDPLIVHIADASQLDALCAQNPPEAEALMRRFWPGPLTLVLPKHESVPGLATSGLPTVAVRMPAHPVALALIRAAGSPLAAPSANLFGRLSPTTAEHVAQDFPQGLDCILDGGACDIGVESTVVGWQGGSPRILRAGGISREELESALGKSLALAEPASPAMETSVTSPGALPWHYAPRTPLVLWDSQFHAVEEQKRSGLLWFGGEPPPQGFSRVENLSPSSDLREAAANLFAALHRLDAEKLTRIYARVVPESGLGCAINDRLRKAAATPAHGDIPSPDSNRLRE